MHFQKKNKTLEKKKDEEGGEVTRKEQKQMKI